jgi:TPR repeat protein/uncharacterized RDD family membrane protein YckC
MFCPQCGAETKPAAKFCHACRHQLEAAPQPTTAPQIPDPAQQITPPEPIVPAKADEALHPWRRFFARTVDLFFLAIPFYAALVFGLISVLPANADKIVGALGNPIVAAVLAYLLWVPVEAALLSNIGTTPAKWVFGISVRKANGQKLTFAEALRRAIFVCIYGDGFGVPFVALFTRAFAYDKLKKTATTKWDTIAGSAVQHSQWGVGRLIGATVVVIAALIVSSVLTIMEKKQEALLTTVQVQASQAGKPQTPAAAAPKAAAAEQATSTQAQQNHDGEMRKYLIAAEQGEAVAQYKIGWMYYKEKNYTEASRWFRLSADQGNPLAQAALGVRFWFGEGVPKDYREAVRLYRLAANQGNSDAQYNLGWAYREGEGVPKNDKEAARQFRLAADSGDANAQDMLGMMYSIGEGVPEDDKEAARFYGLAADQGHTGAQFKLAEMYCGSYCYLVRPERAKTKNGVVAYALYSLLSASDESYSSFRDRVKRHLSDSQLEVGQALTHEMAQGKPTQVIARYLKTGSVAK